MSVCAWLGDMDSTFYHFLFAGMYCDNDTERTRSCIIFKKKIPLH